MLAIQPSSTLQKTTPNLLPARINHNGRIHDTKRYWTPTSDEKGTKHVHFRGRHLHGTTLPLPENYTGAVVNVTEKLAPRSQTTQGMQTSRSHAHTPASENEDDDDDGMDEEDGDEAPEEVRIAEQIGEFDEVVVWGHGGVVDEGSDVFVRGVREWVGFAEAMHCEEGEVEV